MCLGPLVSPSASVELLNSVESLGVCFGFVKGFRVRISDFGFEVVVNWGLGSRGGGVGRGKAKHALCQASSHRTSSCWQTLQCMKVIEGKW